MQTITVRTANLEDETEIAEVNRLVTADLRKVYRPTPRANALRSSIDSELVRLVAIVDGRLVGTVQYRLLPSCLSLLGLGVHPDFRRRWVATALIQTLEQIARETSRKIIRLHTVQESGNVTIFERLGFAIESQDPTNLFESDLHSTLHEVAMSKEIV
jgi:GNAT superfamily N-acetyltransferase